MSESPNPDCPVGQCMLEMLEEMFDTARRQWNRPEKITLAA